MFNMICIVFLSSCSQVPGSCVWRECRDRLCSGWGQADGLQHNGGGAEGEDAGSQSPGKSHTSVNIVRRFQRSLMSV